MTATGLPHGNGLVSQERGMGTAPARCRAVMRMAFMTS
jgi:hypothetical protein